MVLAMWLVDLESAEELYQKRITRILTTDFPHYFAVVTRVRQESNTVGPDGGMIASSVIPQVQAVFPEGALTKNIKVGLQVMYDCLILLLQGFSYVAYVYLQAVYFSMVLDIYSLVIITATHSWL